MPGAPKTLVAAGILALTATVSFAADGMWVPEGDAFRVNTYTIGDQHETGPFAIAASRNSDRFVVVWQSEGQDGDRSGVFAQIYEYDGTPVGTEIRVNERTKGRQFNPAVAMMSDQSFVVAFAGDGGGATQLYTRRFDRAGAPQSHDLRVNTGLGGVDFHPSVAALPGGGFVVAWEALEQVPLPYDVFVRRFDTHGAPLGDEFHASTTGQGGNRRPAIATNEAGSFVVAWASQAIDGDGYGIAVRRFGTDGVGLGDETLVNTTTAGEQDEPDVDLHHDGRFVVVWTGDDGLGDGSTDVFGQDFDEAGARFNEEFVVNSTTVGRQDHPAVAGEGGDAFYTGASYVVTWQSENGDDYGADVLAQSYINLGGRFETEFLVNTRTKGDQTRPGVTTNFGRIVFAWSSFAPLGVVRSNVLAQRYTLCCTTTWTTETTVTTQTTTVTTLPSSTTTLPTSAAKCSQPLTDGSHPTAQDCAFILAVAVGLESCAPDCVCAPGGALPASASDALLCLALAVETPGAEGQCPCASP